MLSLKKNSQKVSGIILSAMIIMSGCNLSLPSNNEETINEEAIKVRIEQLSVEKMTSETSYIGTVMP